MKIVEQGRGSRPDEYGVRLGETAKYAGIAVAAVIAAAVIFVWFFCRIEVEEGEFAPLLRKTGKEISNTDILAPGPEFKGPQVEILQEGRHFRNPYNWYWPRPMKATVVRKGEVGVLVRRVGTPLAEGQIVVQNDEQKGILEGQYNPVRYYLNLWEYDVQIHPMVKIEPGFMGVVTRLVGAEAENSNVFVVKTGERGVQPDLLPPGTFPGYSNPYVFMVTPIDVRSQKFEMGREYVITFPSKYGFDIRVEGTIEWAPDIAKLPELFVKYVDEQDLQESGGINNIQRKVILPYARSYFRMIGAQYRAVDYMTGAPRIRVQNEVLRRLRESCAEQGIEIRAFVIRATEPPKRIREQYERRGMARVEIRQFTEEIKTEIGNIVMEGAKPEIGPDGKTVLDERGNPRLVGGEEKEGPDGKPLREGGRLARAIEERRKDRESKFGQVRVTIVELIRAAEQYQGVEVTKAQRDLSVAKINLEAAEDKAAQALARGTAEAEVIVMKHTAEAEGVKAKVSAFKTGEKYAEYQLIIKFSPGIRRILSNTEGLFARLFERFAKMGTSKETKKD